MAILTHPGHSVENNSMSRQQKQMHETKHNSEIKTTNS